MDEIILAIINRNPTVCVLLSSMSESSKPKVRIGSNKEIKIPLSKIVERSGFEPDNANSLTEVTQEIKEIASEIQFEDIWYSVFGRQSTLTANEISTHLFDQKLDYKNIFAVWIKAYSDPIYFQVKNQDFLVNDKQTVQRILATNTKKQHEQNELNELIRSFNSGKLHETPSKNQLVLIEGLKKIAIYGSKSDKSPALLQLIDKLKTHNSPDKRRKAFDNLVNIGLLSYDEPIELIQNEISEEFPRAVYEELEGANTSKPTCETRLDLTRLESFTIDDERTLDRDDAFSVEKDTIWIHITDMASIINDHPFTEEEAMGRAASLYLPELKIPMLPKLLSEETGSLNPGKIRPCISLKISLDGNGNIHGFNFEETMIKTTASFSYGQVDKILSSKNKNHSEPFYKVAALADKYKEERISNGAISLDRPEMTIELNKQMEVAVRLIEKESKSRSMIENLMVLYNCLAGKFCEENKVPVPFRLQSRPNIPPNQKIPSGQLGWYMLSKMLRPARLSLDPGRHHGLGVDNYVQVTSPIRRYNDLITQKQLKNAMRNLIPPYSDEEILNISTTAQKKIRLLHTIENIRKKYWFLKFLELEKLQGRNIHRAIVLDNNRKFSGNSLIELEKYPFKGRCSVPSHVMGGSTINVELLGIDLWEKSADFRMVKI